MSHDNVLTKEIATQFLDDEDSVDLADFVAIDDEAAEVLAAREGDLSLHGLTSLSNAAAESLSKHKGQLSLRGLKNLSDAAVESLIKHEGTLALGQFENFVHLDVLAARLLLAIDPEADDVTDAIVTIDDEAADVLAESEGDLFLWGPTNMSDVTIEILSRHKGPLGLNGLTSLSIAAADSLGKHKGDLWLNGLTDLNVDAAIALAKHEGTIYLNGLTTLTDAVVEALAKHEGEIGLKSFRPEDFPNVPTVAVESVRQQTETLRKMAFVEEHATELAWEVARQMDSYLLISNAADGISEIYCAQANAGEFCEFEDDWSSHMDGEPYEDGEDDEDE